MRSTIGISRPVFGHIKGCARRMYVFGHFSRVAAVSIDLAPSSSTCKAFVFRATSRILFILLQGTPSIAPSGLLPRE